MTSAKQLVKLCFVSILLTLLLVGCGGVKDAPKLAKVEGTVTYKGEPLNEANVSFIPTSGPVATGRTDASGRFTLSVRGLQGAVLGDHRVIITAFKVTAPSAGAEEGESTEEHIIKPVSRIPEKYGELRSTDLKATITNDNPINQIAFDLK
ncbi:MAG TPA: carboxypeptidase-like regulatory domain-containing protein [Planctomicrobium sp.]|nr:carboxypeptidase-like regulatory domain-containing protein [Planctomicrobium sp.]